MNKFQLCVAYDMQERSKIGYHFAPWHGYASWLKSSHTLILFTYVSLCFHLIIFSPHYLLTGISDAFVMNTQNDVRVHFIFAPTSEDYMIYSIHNNPCCWICMVRLHIPCACILGRNQAALLMALHKSYPCRRPFCIST